MMDWWIWAGAGICLLVVVRCAAHQRHPIRSWIASASCGIGTLALLALLDPFTGVSLPLNRFTGFVAMVLGVPGITGLLLAQLLL